MSFWHKGSGGRPGFIRFVLQKFVIDLTFAVKEEWDRKIDRADFDCSLTKLELGAKFAQQTDQIKSDEPEMRAEIASCESKIDKIRPKIESLRDRMSDFKAQIEGAKAEGEETVPSLKERQKSVNSRKRFRRPRAR
jgi:predicted  nucleic acid-binding Zn-ribbon protein